MHPHRNNLVVSMGTAAVVGSLEGSLCIAWQLPILDEDRLDVAVMSSPLLSTRKIESIRVHSP